MDKKTNKLFKTIEQNYKWLTLLISIVAGFWSVFVYFDNQNEDMARAIQMSEKSIIWNDNVPIVERASVCDDYLSRGYNSYTKKLCENFIMKEVNKDEQGVD